MLDIENQKWCWHGAEEALVLVRPEHRLPVQDSLCNVAPATCRAWQLLCSSVTQSKENGANHGTREFWRTDLLMHGTIQPDRSWACHHTAPNASLGCESRVKRWEQVTITSNACRRLPLHEELEATWFFLHANGPQVHFISAHRSLCFEMIPSEWRRGISIIGNYALEDSKKRRRGKILWKPQVVLRNYGCHDASHGRPEAAPVTWGSRVPSSWLRLLF